MYGYDEKKVVVAVNVKQQLEELIKAVEETPDAITLAFQASGELLITYSNECSLTV